jgi:D-alanyl-D-alanine carboxypeptidase-like protein
MTATDHPDAGRAGFSRRSVLRAGAAAAALAAIPEITAGPASAGPLPAATSGDARTWSPAGRSVSANGWPIGSSVRRSVVGIEGSDATVELLDRADVSAVLQYVARRFHYEVAALPPGGIAGFRPPAKFASQHQSNHCSGTAIEVLPGHYPLGVQAGLYPWQVTVIRDIVAECRGVVRWGGDYPRTADEGHFQIDVGPGDRRLADLAAVFSGYVDQPGDGPGTGEELPFTASSLRRAAAFQRQQGVVS